MLPQSIVDLKILEPGPFVQREDIIQTMWQQQQGFKPYLKTVDGRPAEVLFQGKLNHEQGPDFLDARIQLEGMIWFGAVEIHTSSQFWEIHKHQNDPLYNAVVLHVVLNRDHRTGKLKREDGSSLPEVVLSDYIEQPVRRLKYDLQQTKTQIPCERHWPPSFDNDLSNWLTKLGKQRILSKSQALFSKQIESESMEIEFFKAVVIALGYSQNVVGMKALAGRLSFAKLQSFDSLEKREAYLLGMAGLLSEGSEDKYNQYLIKLFSDMEITDNFPKALWRYAGVRPANFPDRRLAQMAALFNENKLFYNSSLLNLDQIFSVKNERQKYKKLISLLSGELSPYWSNHGRVNVELKRSFTLKPGRQRLNKLIIDVISPFMLSRLGPTGIDRKNQIWDLLSRMKIPSDRIQKLFQPAGLVPQHALQSQGLHHLYRSKCQTFDCMNCNIGRRVLNLD